MLRYVLVAVVVGFAVYYLVVQWPAIEAALVLISWQSAALSFLLVLVGLGFGTLSWVAVLNGLGPRVPVLRAAQVLLVGQLGKYVPGSVWSYVMQMELGRQYGILRPRVLVTALYAAGIGVVSSLLIGALALPVVVQGHTELLWLFLLLPIGLACLHPRVMTFLASFVLKLFRRPPLEHEVTFVVVGKAVGWSLLSYVAYGLHLWLLVNSLVDPDIGTLVLLTGAVSLGFTVGLIAFIFPSGLGVREAILIGAMTLLLTVPQATAVGLISRAMFTAADLLAAGIAILFVFIWRRRLASETVAYLREEVHYEHSLDPAGAKPMAARDDEHE
ncbi:lysylphosphatidylglycerol synthase domain-containing protein [Agromyces ramosus]|uniref:lysylphosphatidylglycerol synthase domain-containing protein n=1 Tax=Agromyces ramosus TaxID=33879 RepID=UPI0027D78C3E|nr:lysylphosphatidylglycerol synthase domain-containing protein [Agromyces ramosus]